MLFLIINDTILLNIKKINLLDASKFTRFPSKREASHNYYAWGIQQNRHIGRKRKGESFIPSSSK